MLLPSSGRQIYTRWVLIQQPEVVGSLFIWNISVSPQSYTVSWRRRRSYNYCLLWKLENSYGWIFPKHSCKFHFHSLRYV